MKKYYYIEYDGHIYLIKKNKKLTLPTTIKNFPFILDEVCKMNFEKFTIYYMHPQIERIPSNWKNKDVLFEERNVDRIVYIAISRTYPRCVSKGIISDSNGKILLMKANIGFSKNKWNLPGGFLNLGETPEEALIRECLEELGINIKIKRLIDIISRVFEDTRVYVLNFIYEATTGDKITINRDEVRDAKYFTVDEALKLVESPFAIEGITKCKLWSSGV